MKALLTLMALAMLASGASAFLIEYRVYDYNTLQPIQSVNVSLAGNGSYEGLTDMNGVIDLTVNATGNFSLIAWRSGYDPVNVERIITSDETETLYMNPASTSGIIRLTVNDISLEDHGFCLYFASNGRLQGCYQLNDTVVIHNNMNYTLRPQVRRLDVVSSVDNSLRYLPYILAPILGTAVALFLAAAMVVILWMIVRKAWRTK